MNWYVVSIFTDDGRVRAEIFSQPEIVDTTPFREFEKYDRYCDKFSTWDAAEKFRKETINEF